MMAAELMRIQRYLSQAGVCSRRASEKLVEAGRVRVDGRVASIGDKVDPETCRVEVDGVPVRRTEEKRYLLFHKPFGVLCTRDDPFGRRTVQDEIEGDEYLYPVGRLDLRSSGVLLMTNDGTLTHRLLHPKGLVEKVYRVKILDPLSMEQMARIRRGEVLVNGRPTAPARIRSCLDVLQPHWYELVITEGRKRQVRQMMESFGRRVIKLVRVGFAGLTLRGLPPGRMRPLSGDEVAHLRELAGV